MKKNRLLRILRGSRSFFFGFSNKKPLQKSHENQDENGSIREAYH